MSGKVKCTCGWSWNKSDSSKKDMYVCHECGKDNSNSIKVDRDIFKAQDGLKTISTKDRRGIDLLLEETKNSNKDRKEFLTTGMIKNPKSIAYKSKLKKQPEFIQDNRNDFEKEYDRKKGQAIEDKKQLKKNIIAPLDFATDIMQAGNFIPHPVGQGFGKVGNILGAGIDAYQAYDELSEDNYTDAAINAGSVFLPIGLDSKTFRRNSKYLKPGQPLNFLKGKDRVNYIEPFTKVKGMTNTSLLANRALLGTLGAETMYDIPKQKNGGWLDNYNDVKITTPEGYVGEGTSNKGRNYSPAWGGQFQGGGSVKKSFNPNLAKKDKEFQKWYKENTWEAEEGKPYSENLDYDFYSFYKNKEYTNPEFNKNDHFPDTYKRPTHPTFSNESIYSTPEKPGGQWDGDNYNPKGEFKYQMGGSIPGAVGFSYARTQGAAPSNGKYAKKTMASAQNGKEMQYYQEGLDWQPKTISKNGAWLDGYEEGGIIKDDRGQWDHPGEITEIGSNQITMQGVPYDVLGISDTGDIKLMKPGKNYKFKGKKVTEFPMAQDGTILNLSSLPKVSSFKKQPFTLKKETNNVAKDKVAVKSKVINPNKKISKEAALKIAKDNYYNPEILDITSGDKKLDLLYKNDWLMDLPIVGDYIKDKAKTIAMQGPGPSRDYTELADDKAPSIYTGAMTPRGMANQDTKNLIKGPLNQYFGENIYSDSKYKPTSDYLQFLPSYSVKDKKFESEFNKRNLIDDSNGEFPIVNLLSNGISEIANEDDYNQFLKNKKSITKYYDEESNISKLLQTNMGGHRTSLGWDIDNNLPYISVSDAWDFSPEEYSDKWSFNSPKEDQENLPDEIKEDERKRKEMLYIQSALMHKAGKPFKIYDRLYFDPKTKEYISDDKIKPTRYSVKEKKEFGGQLKKLNQLTNFTNYNKPQPGGWLNKYN